MESNHIDSLKAKSDEINLEIAKLTSLISLCDSRGIPQFVSSEDVSNLAADFLSQPTDLGYVLLKSRLRSIHSQLHELLYAPPGRN